MADLQTLMARKAKLLKELEDLDVAIAAFSNPEPVEIWTSRNVRNTGWLSTNLQAHEGVLIVFEDAGLTSPADERSHCGFVLRSAWAQYKLDHPEMISGDQIGEA
jgi:hypothetical protein